MKKFALLALLLGVFAVGCAKQEEPAAPAGDAAAPAADTAAPAEGAPAEESGS